MVDAAKSPEDILLKTMLAIDEFEKIIEIDKDEHESISEAIETLSNQLSKNRKDLSTVKGTVQQKTAANTERALNRVLRNSRILHETQQSQPLIYAIENFLEFIADVKKGKKRVAGVSMDQLSGGGGRS